MGGHLSAPALAEHPKRKIPGEHRDRPYSLLSSPLGHAPPDPHHSSGKTPLALHILPLLLTFAASAGATAIFEYETYKKTGATKLRRAEGVKLCTLHVRGSGCTGDLPKVSCRRPHLLGGRSAIALGRGV